jgi:hypothetical protein
MGAEILRHCGVFALPQLALSMLTVTLVVGYLVAIRRREIARGDAPWSQTLEPLSGISTTVGLLGSVAGFIVAFGGFANGLDVDRLTSGLAGAYWTTGVGIVTSLIASGGAYLMTVWNRQETQR